MTYRREARRKTNREERAGRRRMLPPPPVRNLTVQLCKLGALAIAQHKAGKCHGGPPAAPKTFHARLNDYRRQNWAQDGEEGTFGRASRLTTAQRRNLRKQLRGTDTLVPARILHAIGAL